MRYGHTLWKKGLRGMCHSYNILIAATDLQILMLSQIPQYQTASPPVSGSYSLLRRIGVKGILGQLTHRRSHPAYGWVVHVVGAVSQAVQGSPRVSTHSLFECAIFHGMQLYALVGLLMMITVH